MYYRPHFSTQMPQTSKALCQWEEHLSLFCMSVNFVFAANLRQPRHYSQTFFPEDPKEVEIWGSNIWAVWQMGNNSPSQFCDCLLCFHTGVVMHCNVGGRFHQHFVKSTLLKLFCKVLRVWMYTSELMVWPCGTMPIKISSSAYNKRSHDSLPKR